MKILCKLHLHKWKYYNNKWRRICLNCQKLQVFSKQGWRNTNIANFEGKDTIIS